MAQLIPRSLGLRAYHGEWLFTRVVGMGATLTLMALAHVGLLLLAWGQHVVLAAAGCVSAGLGFYMLHNTLQTQATQMAPHARGSAVTLFACMLFFGQSAGVLLAAQTVDRGSMDWTYTIAALGMVVLGRVVARQVRAKS